MDDADMRNQIMGLRHGRENNGYVRASWLNDGIFSPEESHTRANWMRDNRPLGTESQMQDWFGIGNAQAAGRQPSLYQQVNWLGPNKVSDVQGPNRVNDRRDIWPGNYLLQALGVGGG